MEILKDWIAGICAAAIIVSLAKAIAPQNSAGKCVQLVGALIIILAVISPFKNLRVSDVGKYEREYLPEFERLSGDLEEENEKIKASIIEEEMSTYISKRAVDSNVILSSVSVKTKKADDGNFYPVEVRMNVDNTVSDNSKENLKKIIRQECGISSDKIAFSVQGG